MDDLDHSIHIAENVWVRFLEVSEECNLSPPSLAWIDGPPTASNGSPHCQILRPMQHAAHIDTEPDESQSNDLLENSWTNSTDKSEPEDVNREGEGNGVEEEDSQPCSDGPGGNEAMDVERVDQVTEANIGDGTVQGMKSMNREYLESLELAPGVQQMQTETLNLEVPQEHGPLSHNRASVDEKVSHSTGESEDVSSITVRPEEELLFVRVNMKYEGEHEKQQTAARALSTKRKQRQKRLCRDQRKSNHELAAGDQTRREGEVDGALRRKPGHRTRLENLESEALSDCSESENEAQNVEQSESRTAGSIEQMVDGNERELCSSVENPQTHHLSTLHSVNVLDEESDGCEDEDRGFSTPSYDSENYFSASESMDQLQQLCFECPSCLTSYHLTDSPSANTIPDLEKHSSKVQIQSVDITIPASSVCEGSEPITDGIHVEPPASQRTHEKQEDNLESQHLTGVDIDQHRAISPRACGVSESGCQDDKPQLPVSTEMPSCEVTSSSDASVQMHGPARPVFAISAFWDEMEKLTIKDILHLRMGTTLPATQSMQGTADGGAEIIDVPSSVAEAVESADGGPMDMSEAADSDYFTLLDDSKTDRSSWEFSVLSDCEEEYLQFISGNSSQSPDFQNKIHQSLEGTSEVLVQDSQEDCLWSASPEISAPHVDSHTQLPQGLRDPWQPRWLAKTQSLHNLQTLFSLHAQEDLLPKCNTEASMFPRISQTLEENTKLRLGDTLTGVEMKSKLNKISFPEVPDSLLRDDEMENSCRSVRLCDPKHISVCCYDLCASMHEMPGSGTTEKPIPIFSSSHTAGSDLTFTEVEYFFPQNRAIEEQSHNKAIALFDGFATPMVVSRPLHGKRWARKGWKSLLSMRNIRFHHRGSMWCRRSGGWVLPVQMERRQNNQVCHTIALLREEAIRPQILSELAVEQNILETMQTILSSTKRESIFAVLRQSDMCLVCIAVASWVLRTTDLKDSEGWKATLLANVSALSAIQYLRQYFREDSLEDAR